MDRGDSHGAELGQGPGVSGKPVGIGPSPDPRAAVGILVGFVNHGMKSELHQFKGRTQACTACPDNGDLCSRLTFRNSPHALGPADQRGIIKGIVREQP